jgi:autotransporter-associated beta strand protein
MNAALSPTTLTLNNNTEAYTLGVSGNTGKITGGASLNLNGTAAVTLLTANDYLGGTTIAANAGAVTLGDNTAAADDGMIGSSGAVVHNGTLLVNNNYTNETLAAPISGGGPLVSMGRGILTLSGNNSAYSGWISNSDILQMGNGFTGTLGTGNVTNNRTLLFNVGPTPASTVVVSANIAGAGGITNVGPGIVQLSGNNTYAGSTVISEGTIQLGSATALPITTAVCLNDNNSPGLVGTLDLNGNNATIASLQGTNAGQGNATLVECQIVNNLPGTTATLTIGGGSNTVFNGQLTDNNNGGTGKLALMVTNDTTLTLNACFNNLTVNTYPNLFSGGMTISNAQVCVGTDTGTPPGNEGGASAGIGPITLCGGLGTVTNWNIRMPSNGMLYASGNTELGGSSTTPTIGTALSGPLVVPTGQYGTLVLSGRGTVSCTLQGGGTLIVNPNYVRGEVAGDWTAFTGTIIFQYLFGASGDGGFSIISPLGYPNATLYMQTTNLVGSVSISGANGGNVFPIGALAGGDNTSLIGGGTQGNGGSGGAANTIWAIGGLGLNTTNGSQIVDAGCGIRVVGGSLTLTNNTLSFGGQCVVSNATLAFVPITIISNTLANNYLVGTNFTIVNGILDVTGTGAAGVGGLNATLYLGHNASGQSLFGNGMLKGSLVTMAGTNTVVAPGNRVGSPASAGSQLTVSGTATFNNGSTVIISINSTNGVGGTFTNDIVNALGGLTVNQTRLTIVNTGGAFAPSSTNLIYAFWDPNTPVAVPFGASGVTNLTLPALGAGEYWVTNLSGGNLVSLAVVDTNVPVTINPSRPPVQVTVSGSTLTLGWPTNKGWVLQAQTNAANVGLSNNWADLPAYTGQTQAVLTINPTNPAVFYRLRMP